jgi:hypothetical protein
MPLGGSELALGSLEFIDRTQSVGTLFGHAGQITGTGIKRDSLAIIPGLHLCVMNPPFTRSVGDNLLFGNMPESERAPMQKRLQKLVSSKNLSASITAGLGSVFAALADAHLLPGSTLALVLPKALICGPSWQPTREMIAASYFVDYIITSHESGHWNFSENTALSEVLIVARKIGASQSVKAKTTYLNLWRQPKNSIEALTVASQIAGDDLPDVLTAASGRDIMVGEK